MKNIAVNIAFLMIMTIGIEAENLNTTSENNMTANTNQPIKIKTVRGVLGEYDLMEHTNGQLRAGYITFSEDGSSRKSAYALAGHYHFDTKRWNGLMIGAEAYTVLNLGINQNSLNVNSDFFNADNQSFITLSQAYLDGKWGNTEIKLGRQTLDTPHVDSDDIRMMPNYFEAYTITNTDMADLTLTAGYIRKMAGWENGVDSAKFVNIYKTLEVDKSTDGVYYASASYEGIRDLSLNLWYYNYNDIANVVYAEAGYNYAFSKDRTLTLGFQYDSSKESGAALLGKQDSNTFGLSMELALEDVGLHILGAYNQDNGETGAMGLSLGGGAFFTSMEDQTLDAIGSSGKAWMAGAGYHFEAIGIDGLIAAIAYGDFKADKSSLYESNEIDAIIDYTFSDKFSLTAAFASVNFKMSGTEDYKQFRVVANYNF
jgi:hypothetical protein